MPERDEVVGLDNFNAGYDRSVNERSLAGFVDRISFIEGDVCDAKLLSDVFDKHAFDAVSHSAALAGPNEH
jgi:UDP-glucose 4-epimerase